MGSRGFSWFLSSLSSFVLRPHKKTPASMGLQEHIDGIVKLFT